MRTSNQYPNRCGNCGDPITPDGTLHVWSGRVGMPDHPYDHPAEKRPTELEDPYGEAFDLFENLRPGQVEALRRQAIAATRPSDQAGGA